MCLYSYCSSKLWALQLAKTQASVILLNMSAFLPAKYRYPETSIYSNHVPLKSYRCLSSA